MSKILAIDDKKDNLIAVSALLKNLIKKCTVITARSGPEGIEKAKSERPDVILLDIRMPDMDGYEACKRLKADEGTSNIPIIMLTAIKTDVKDRIRGLALGADAFLSKPIDPAELAAQVGVMIRIKNAEDALRRERDECKTRAKELENFAYTVSHDLKAPLVNLGGYTTLLLKMYHETLDEKGRHYLEVLQKNVKRMEEFIRDLLELSRIGRVLGRQENVDIDGIVRETIEELGGRIKEKSVDLVIAKNLPASFGDRERIREIFSNLVDNAIKFLGERSGPVVEIGCRESGDGSNLFYVKDNGIGIDGANHEKIFQEFHRINDIDADGTGIGLAIVKKIIETHGCRIWLESKKGEGSTFYFTLPKGGDGG